MRIKELLQENRLGELTPEQNFLLFGSKNTVQCVDGKHFRPFDYDDWVECGELEDVHYTWYIPNVAGNAVKPGDLLMVETTVEHGVSLVVAVGAPYELTREQLRAGGHPYCGVLANLGAVELANGKTAYEIGLG